MGSTGFFHVSCSYLHDHAARADVGGPLPVQNVYSLFYIEYIVHMHTPHNSHNLPETRMFIHIYV